MTIDIGDNFLAPKNNKVYEIADISSSGSTQYANDEISYYEISKSTKGWKTSYRFELEYFIRNATWVKLPKIDTNVQIGDIFYDSINDLRYVIVSYKSNNNNDPLLDKITFNDISLLPMGMQVLPRKKIINLIKIQEWVRIPDVTIKIGDVFEYTNYKFIIKNINYLYLDEAESLEDFFIIDIYERDGEKVNEENITFSQMRYKFQNSINEGYIKRITQNETPIVNVPNIPNPLPLIEKTPSLSPIDFSINIGDEFYNVTTKSTYQIEKITSNNDAQYDVILYTYQVNGIQKQLSHSRQEIERYLFNKDWVRVESKIPNIDLSVNVDDEFITPENKTIVVKNIIFNNIDKLENIKYAEIDNNSLQYNSIPRWSFTDMIATGKWVRKEKISTNSQNIPAIPPPTGNAAASSIDLSIKVGDKFSLHNDPEILIEITTIEEIGNNSDDDRIGFSSDNKQSGKKTLDIKSRYLIEYRILHKYWLRISPPIPSSLSSSNYNKKFSIGDKFRSIYRDGTESIIEIMNIIPINNNPKDDEIIFQQKDGTFQLVTQSRKMFEIIIDTLLYVRIDEQRQEIIETIEALKILADMGDVEAQETIVAMQILLS